MCPTSSCSSCFCTSSGTPLMASALVIPSSVALIHVSSELREKEGYWCTLHSAFGNGWLVSVVLSVSLHDYGTCLKMMPI